MLFKAELRVTQRRVRSILCSPRLPHFYDFPHNLAHPCFSNSNRSIPFHPCIPFHIPPYSRAASTAHASTLLSPYSTRCLRSEGHLFYSHRITKHTLFYKSWCLTTHVGLSIIGRDLFQHRRWCWRQFSMGWNDILYFPESRRVRKEAENVRIMCAFYCLIDWKRFCKNIGCS